MHIRFILQVCILRCKGFGCSDDFSAARSREFHVTRPHGRVRLQARRNRDQDEEDDKTPSHSKSKLEIDSSPDLQKFWQLDMPSRMWPGGGPSLLQPSLATVRNNSLR